MKPDDLPSLLALADDILLEDLSVPELVAAIERYSDRFAAWFTAQGGKFEAQDKKQLELLLEKHSAILKRAEGLKGLTAENMRELKKKGKGIMAYVDVLPKKISTRRAKKG